MCCLVPKRKQCLGLLSPPSFKRSRTEQPLYDKLPTHADMGANQTTPEKVELEDGFSPTSDLYGLFSSPGKAANNHEEQQVGRKSKYYLVSCCT